MLFIPLGIASDTPRRPMGFDLALWRWILYSLAAKMQCGKPLTPDHFQIPTFRQKL